MSDPERRDEIGERGAAEAAAHVVVVAGRAGAGRTTAMAALEDFGYERLDTPLPGYAPAIVRELLARGARRVAVGVDGRGAAREPGAFARLAAAISAPPDGEWPRPRVTVVFLDGSDEALRRRYTETRRRHPLSPTGSVEQGLEIDRRIAAELRGAADIVIDTTSFAPGELKRALRDRVAGRESSGPIVTVMSFAYREGLPEEADLVFDCRFLRNPHYDPNLRARDGRDPEVVAHVAADPLYEPYLEQLGALARLLLPAFVAEGKSYVTIAFGCTGGRHRSVATAEAFARRLTEQGWAPVVRHREQEGETEGGPAAAAAEQRTSRESDAIGAR